MLGFQAQLSQDNQTLQIAFYQADQNNQPQQVGMLVLQRSAGGQPGMGQPGQMPGMTQPGATQPGSFPTTPQQPGAPGSFPTAPQQPGAFPTTPQQPSAPGSFPTTPQQPGAGQPGMGQQPGLGQPGLGSGQPAMPAGDWNGAFVGNAGQLVMAVQPSGQQGQYVGYFEAGGQRYEFQATGTAEYLEGVYLVNGQQVPFYAQRYEGGVYLIDGSDGTEYILAPAGG